MNPRDDANQAAAQNGKSGASASMDRRKFLRAAAGTAGTIAVGGILLGHGGCSAKTNTLKIVSSLPRTGSAQGQTNTIVNGIKMAIADYGGEIAGLKLVHQDMDDATAAQGQWDAGKEADNAREAVGDADAMVFIGPYNSGAAKVSMPILNEAGMLQISPAATWPGLTKKVPGQESSGEPDIYRPSGKITFCRVCPTDDTQGPLSAVFAKDNGFKRVFILDDKELYGAGIAGLFRKKCEELKLEVLGHESIVSSQKSFKTLMQSIKGKNPDLIYFGGTTQSGGPQIAIDMKGEGLSAKLMVPDGCYEQEFIKGAGADVLNEMVYATIGGKDPSQLTGAGAEFVMKYRDTYKAEPEAYAAYGYEAAKVFLEALKKVGKKDREELRKAVLATKDFSAGVLGKWSFNADGDTTSQVLTISMVKDGKFVPQKCVEG